MLWWALQMFLQPELQLHSRVRHKLPFMWPSFKDSNPPNSSLSLVKVGGFNSSEAFIHMQNSTRDLINHFLNLTAAFVCQIDRRWFHPLCSIGHEFHMGKAKSSCSRWDNSIYAIKNFPALSKAQKAKNWILTIFKRDLSGPFHLKTQSKLIVMQRCPKTFDDILNCQRLDRIPGINIWEKKKTPWPLSK